MPPASQQTLVSAKESQHKPACEPRSPQEQRLEDVASIGERKREAGTRLGDASSARNGIVDIQMAENMEIEKYEQGIFKAVLWQK